MSMAPRSRIKTAPVPGLSGTSFTVTADEGARFPTPPFERWVALVHERNQLPILGENAEEVTVLDIEADTFTIERAEDADLRIDIEVGMAVSLLRHDSVYRLGEDVTLTGSFEDDEAPYSLLLRTPGGEIETHGTATITDPGDGTPTYTFEPERAGHWAYRWASDLHVHEERGFFVIFGLE